MQISGMTASGTFSATDVLAIEVNVNGTNKTYKLTGATLAAALASIGSYLTTSDIVNNLTSTATNKPLSAAQGKVLNEKIRYIDTTVNISDCEFMNRGGWYRGNIGTADVFGILPQFVQVMSWTGTDMPVVGQLDGHNLQLICPGNPNSAGYVVVRALVIS